MGQVLVKKPGLDVEKEMSELDLVGDDRAKQSMCACHDRAGVSSKCCNVGMRV